MKRIWQVLLVVILLAVAGVGLYYYAGFLNTPKPTAANITTTQVLANDFLFQVSVDKSAYRHEEPIIVYFNLTYLGKSPRIIRLPEEVGPFTISMRNATHTLTGSWITIGTTADYTFTPGKSVIGRGTISKGSFSIEPNGPSGSFPTLSVGNTYNIDGSVRLLGLTAPSLTIQIIK